MVHMHARPLRVRSWIVVRTHEVLLHEFDVVRSQKRSHGFDQRLVDQRRDALVPNRMPQVMIKVLHSEMRRHGVSTAQMHGRVVHSNGLWHLGLYERATGRPEFSVAFVRPRCQIMRELPATGLDVLLNIFSVRSEQLVKQRPPIRTGLPRDQVLYCQDSVAARQTLQVTDAKSIASGRRYSQTVKPRARSSR
eukprot:SAG31_NODE_12794_length_916_cov_1.386781_1_plen_193_part_00